MTEYLNNLPMMYKIPLLAIGWFLILCLVVWLGKCVAWRMWCSEFNSRKYEEV